MLKRLFIGIPLPERVKEEILSISEKFKSSVNATFVKKNNYHITLKFLGNSEEKKIINVLNKIRYEKFELRLQDLGVFPNKNFPRVLWVGVEDNKDCLRLHELINKALPQFPNKNSFHPHVTIARIKFVKNKQFFEHLLKEKIFFGKININSFILYESILNPKGAIYKKIKEFPLKLDKPYNSRISSK